MSMKIRHLESRERVSWLQKLATIILAFMLNGLLVWVFLPAKLLEGTRGLIMGLGVLLFQVAIGIVYQSRLFHSTFIASLLIACQVLVFTCALLVGDMTAYGMWKLQGFILFAAMPSVFILWNYARRTAQIAFLYRCLFFTSFLPFFLPLVYHDLFSNYARWLLMQMELDVIGLGRSVGMGALLALAFALRARGWARAILAIVYIIMMTGQIIIEERGPLLALMVSSLFLLFMCIPANQRIWERPLRIYGLVLIAMASVVVLPMIMPRFQLENITGESRLSIIGNGLQVIEENPILGVGLGAFSYGNDISYSQHRQYFHNIFGEVLSETGLMGLAPFLLFLLFPLYFRYTTRAPLQGDTLYWHQVSKGLFIFSLIASQVSGDITNNYMVWVTASLVLCSALPQGSPK